MITFPSLLVAIVAAFAGGALSMLISKMPRFNEEDFRKKTEAIIHKSKDQAQAIVQDSKERCLKIMAQNKEEHQRLEASLLNLEKAVDFKEQSLKKRQERLKEMELIVGRDQASIRQFQEATAGLDQAFIEKLVEKTGVAKEEAKNQLVNEFNNLIIISHETRLAKFTEQVKEEAKMRAKNIVTEAIHRFSAATSVERKLTTIEIKDRNKGQLMGTDGKGALIQKLENILEVDLIFNDLPDSVTISGGEPMKRYIATVTMEYVAKEKTITEARIMELLEKAKKDTEAIILKEAAAAIKVIGLKEVPADLIRIIGRLKFRTSYGQNILKHSLEVAAFGTILAAEIGADITLSRFACFLHDIGKAIDYEVEGTHDAIGRDLLIKYGYPEAIIHAVYAHHEAVPCVKAEDYLVKAADAISAGRPGARQESLEKYLTRLHDLETIATSFAGVQKTYAISAGREVRVIVDPLQIDDLKTEGLAGDIAHTIESKLTYPGKIKVNVIRRTIAVEYAK